LLRVMIDTGALATLLKEVSPRINAQWLATAVALCEGEYASPCRTLYFWMLPAVLGCHLLLFVWGLATLTPNGMPYGWRCSDDHVFGQRCPTDNSTLYGAGDDSHERYVQAFFSAASAYIIAVVCDVTFLFLASLALPLIRLPLRDSPLRQLPDAGLLVLVLLKLRITQYVAATTAHPPTCHLPTAHPSTTSHLPTAHVPSSRSRYSVPSIHASRPRWSSRAALLCVRRGTGPSHYTTSPTRSAKGRAH
jgi:hypothetical protein